MKNVFISGPFTGLSPFVRNIVRKVLTRLGYTVLEKNGEESRDVKSLIDLSNHFVFIIGSELPSIRDAWGHTLVETELQYATSHDIPVTVIMLDVENENKLPLKIKELRNSLRINSILLENFLPDDFSQKIPQELFIRKAHIVYDQLIRLWENGLLRTIEKYDELNKSPYYMIIRNACKSLIHELVRDGNIFKKIDWRNVEHLFAELFEGLGYKTFLTPSSKDGGKDLILEDPITSEAIYVEIKNWYNREVTKQVKQRMIEVLVRDKVDRGIIIGTQSHTAKKINLKIEQKVIHIAGQREVKTMCRAYLSNQFDIIYEDTELSNSFTEEYIKYCTKG